MTLKFKTTQKKIILRWRLGPDIVWYHVCLVLLSWLLVGYLIIQPIYQRMVYKYIYVLL
mgnify:CR=1 FL=1